MCAALTTLASGAPPPDAAADARRLLSYKAATLWMCSLLAGRRLPWSIRSMPTLSSSSGTAVVGPASTPSAYAWGERRGSKSKSAAVPAELGAASAIASAGAGSGGRINDSSASMTLTLPSADASPPPPSPSSPTDSGLIAKGSKSSPSVSRTDARRVLRPASPTRSPCPGDGGALSVDARRVLGWVANAETVARTQHSRASVANDDGAIFEEGWETMQPADDLFSVATQIQISSGLLAGMFGKRLWVHRGPRKPKQRPVRRGRLND